MTSPILSNIYLDRLDKYVENVLVPEYTRGGRRAPNPAFRMVQYAITRARDRAERDAVRQLRQQLRQLPSKDPQDPGYRRLKYVRYADDTLLGFIGPKAEAEQIKTRLAMFLRDDLKLELSQQKTLITHARTGAARFLGYEITVQHSDRKITSGQRRLNGTIGLRVPKTVIKAKCVPYLKRGKPANQPQLRNLDDHLIIGTYGAQYRGFIQYYLLAGDVWKLNRLRWVMETSMLKTLAAKRRSSVTKMARKYKATIDTPHGPRICFQASVERNGRKTLARFGGISLKRQKKAVLHDRRSALGPPRRKGNELIRRLRAGRCELCEQRADTQVHHVRKLTDLATRGRPQPEWAELMARMRRKTLVVCAPCHDTIHSRQPIAIPRSSHRRAG